MEHILSLALLLGETLQKKNQEKIEKFRKKIEKFENQKKIKIFGKKSLP